MQEWIEKNNTISKEFTLEDFAEVMMFVNEVAALAEDADHHPDIFIHNYKYVTVTLTTHSEGGVVTEKDRSLASEIEAIELG